MDINQILQQIDEYYGKNQGREAEALMLQCMEQAVAEENDGILLQLLNELLGYYRETSQVEQSFVIAERAMELAGQVGAEDSLPYATTLLNVANAYRAGGRLTDSLACYQQVREIYAKRLQSDNMLVASLENNISLLYQEMGEYAKAKDSLLKALEIVQAKNADFEIAVTYANLATTCLLLQEKNAVYQYSKQSIMLFEELGVHDFHYGAALAALGGYYFQKQSYQDALSAFERAREIMETSLGQNEYYQRLTENVEACKTAMKRTDIKGLALCRAYYETYGRPMIAEKFPAYESSIAVGLVGEGSDCFGFDDKISQDHDWGPGFCMWVTEETYREIGDSLQKAYEQLPEEFEGYHRQTVVQGRGRRGVMTIDAFYERLLQSTSYEAINWQQVTDAALAAAVNGEVFRDDEGLFSAFREKLQAGYPERILYLKLAESVALFSQSGQYNYERMLQRGDALTASIMLTDAVRSALRLKLCLAGKYPPHDKWLRRSVEELPDGDRLLGLLKQLRVDFCGENGAGSDIAVGASEKVQQNMEILEQVATLLVKELYDKHFVSDVDNYLDAHTEELLSKASMAGFSNEELAEKIAELEFEAFDKVQNVGGRADCQNDWATFSIMRKSQYLTWNRTMLLQYYYDFQREYRKGHNLITEKYGRMMESTAPAEYEKLKEHFPVISPEKKAIIEEIVGLQVGWMEEFAKEYPRLAENARSVHSEEDHLFNTSYETYLRGEISTYSDKMLELYGRYIVEYARQGKNLAYDIMTNNVHLYGYADLDAAERFLGL